MRILVLIAFILPVVAGCTPEVGSERWCEKMAETPKGEWTADDAGVYTKSCVLGLQE